MTIKKTWAGCIAASAFLVAVGSAGAAVVGFSPNADFSETPFTISFGDNTASYTFSNSGMSDGIFSTLPQVTTGGTATIASLGAPFNNPPKPTTYFTDPDRSPFFDDSLLASFLSYAEPGVINAPTDSYVALQFALDDGTHFGFARLAGLTLFDYAYETTPGAGIQTTMDFSPAVSPVPLPAAFPLLGLGLAALGGVAAKRRKRAA